MFRLVVLFFGYMAFLGLCFAFAFVFIIWFFANPTTMGQFFRYMFSYEGRGVIYKIGLAYFAIMIIIALFYILVGIALFGILSAAT